MSSTVISSFKTRGAAFTLFWLIKKMDRKIKPSLYQIYTLIKRLFLLYSVHELSMGFLMVMINW